MADIELIIKIPEEIYHKTIEGIYEGEENDSLIIDTFIYAITKGTPLHKGHGFIAICDSDFPITEEVKQELKNTVFVGNEDCRYCFDITEIIEADRKEQK